MCARAAPSRSPSPTLSLSLPLTFTIYDAFWNSIKNECVWHKTNERKCVKRKEKRKWDNHTSLFKHLTSWYIVQYSSLRLVCFSLSLSLLWFLSFIYSRLRRNTSIYIEHGCKQTSLFDIRRLLSFFSHTLTRIVCLRQWLFFHFQNVYVCMSNHETTTTTSKYCESSNTLFAYSPNESYVNFRSIECALC